jgi:ribonuclease HI
VAVLDEAGRCVEGHGGFLGQATNNVAEYNGLLAALELAAARGAEQVELFADSELIVRQIQGRYRVKNAGLKPLFAEAMRRIGRFALFSIDHVPRERNKDADRLANAVLDRAEADPQSDTVEIHERYEPEAVEGAEAAT